WRDDPSSSSP
ncbi:hypothetical protein CFC21_056625, partial [Triticum aestivum]